MLYFHGFGHFHPENEITNAFLEELDIGTNDAWILDRVGIRARRSVLPLDYIRATRNADVRASGEAATCTQAQMGERAARMAIARAGLTPADIGMVISGSSAPDTLSPADACNLAQQLGRIVAAQVPHVGGKGLKLALRLGDPPMRLQILVHVREVAIATHVVPEDRRHPVLAPARHDVLDVGGLALRLLHAR